jgi:GTP cyclohydrolase IA
MTPFQLSHALGAFMLYRFQEEVPVQHDRDAIAAAVSALLRATGHDPSNESDLQQTPDRVARLWIEEFLAGYAMDPAKILGEPVLGENDPDVVVVSGLRFHSMCPHHLVPFRGLAHVAYIPAGKLAGFGRLADLVECLTKRLTLQERATHQIAEAIWHGLDARGAGCVMEAEQWCLALPGERHNESRVVTGAFVGEFDQRPDLKARLYHAAGGGAVTDAQQGKWGK